MIIDSKRSAKPKMTDPLNVTSYEFNNVVELPIKENYVTAHEVQ